MSDASAVNRMKEYPARSLVPRFSNTTGGGAIVDRTRRSGSVEKSLVFATG